jgi:pilus assembly protein Flp/PilA
MTSFDFLRLAKSAVGRFLADQRGATAIEYGLMVALIGMAIIATVFSTGQGIKDTLYGRITNALAAM